MRVAFDLTALQEALAKYPKYKELNQHIKRFVSAMSFLLDLQSAQTSISVLKEINPTDGKSRMNLGQPLMMHAVMMYCRAALEDGNGRWPLGVVSSYSAEQRQMHKDVTALRHKCMAHFGVGEGRYGQSWIKETAVLKFTSEGGGVVEAWTRTNYLAQLIFDLDSLCETATETVSAKLKQRHEALHVLLQKLLETDSEFLQILKKYPFTPEDFFASTDAAEPFWGSNPMRQEINTLNAVTSDFSVRLGPPIVTNL